MHLSIIIPTINRPKDISRILDCFFVQSYENYQIIIIDQSDNNETWIICDKYIIKWVNILYHKYNIKSGAKARNFAISLLDRNTDVVIFMDDDVSFEKNFLENLNKYIYSHKNIVWWTWKIISPTRKIWFMKKIWIFLLGWWRDDNKQKVTRTWFNQLFGKQPNIEDKVQWTSWCGMRFRKSVINRWYKFPNEFLKYSIMEDLFFSYQIYLDHKDLLNYTPSVEMIHHESPNRTIPNYQKIRQHCIHRYLFHKKFHISILWYIWTILFLMISDILMFHNISIFIEYYKSLKYIYQNRKNINIEKWDRNKFIFE